MASDKVQSLLQWPISSTSTTVISFLGLANFYKRFIKHFSKLAYPLTQLTYKDTLFVWTQICQAAFDALKTAISSAPILRHIDPALPFSLETDVSSFVIEAVCLFFP